MEGASSLFERQRNEAHAIQAIYTDEYEEVKPAWNVANSPPHFVIHLKTADGLALDVGFQLSARYPLDLPIITLTRRRGLLAAQVNDLFASMSELAKGCVGREMVFDLIEHAKDALQAFGQKKVSFHDQMLMDRQQRAMLAEAEVEAGRKEAMVMESKIREELERKLIPQANSSSSTEELSGEYITFDPELLFYEPGQDFAKYIGRVSVIKSLGQRKYENSIDVEELEVSFERNHLILKKLNVSSISRQEPEKFARKIESFLKRVNDVGMLTSNPYVLRVIGCQLVDNLLYILSEKSSAKPLLQVFRTVPSKLSELKVILKQLVVGLNHIHQSNFIHKDLRLDTIYYDQTTNTVQIGDCHLHHELNILLHREDFPAPISWLPSELKERAQATRKTDVWFLGIIFIQLLYGLDITAKYPNWTALKSAINPSSQLASLLDNVFQTSSNYRIATNEIMKHDFFEGTAGAVFTGDMTSLGGGKRSMSSSTSRGNFNSRFETDFEQLEILGRGGFGEVVKARNRVDNRFYAIKKINLDPENVDYNRKILREVMTLSRLQHDRVVRYYQAWIEGSSQQQSTVAPPGNISTSGTFGDTTSSDSDASDYIDFVNTSRDWLGDSLLDNPSHPDPSIEVSLMKLNKTGFSDDSGTASATSSSMHFDDTEDTPINYQTLYIQMEYCPKRTLRDMIDEGLEPAESWRLFRQIVEGLVYIHSQGMIHRDLKPSNVFMDNQGNVKIGDFGLATSTTSSFTTSKHRKSTADHHSSSMNESLTAGIGTPFYTSPEQEQPKSRYNNKVDMYSLGIIFLELWCRFDTAMERAECLKEARLPGIHLPKQFEAEELSKQQAVLLNLLSHDPKQRMSSSELLESDFLPLQIENEQINSVLKTVTNPVNPAFSNLIELLFKNAPDSLKDFAYDFNSSNVFEAEQLVKISAVKDALVRVFERHGAVCTSVPLFQLSSIDLPDAMCVLDSTGQRLDLPFDLTRPFARFVARNGISEYRRYAIERIFRRPVLPGGQPKQPIECDFDLVFSHGDGILEEAEVLKVAVDAVTEACDCSQQQLTLIVSNVHVSKLIAQALGVDENVFVDFLHGIQHFGAQKRLSSLLSKFPNISPEKVNRLVNGDNSKNKHQVLIDVLGKYGRLAQPLLKHLSTLVDILRSAFDLKQMTIVIDPLFVHSPSLYNCGLVFQLLLLANHSKRKRAVEVLAAGGRYDQLLSSFKYPSAYGTFTGAVGVAFSVNKLALLSTRDPTTVKVYLWPSTEDVPKEDMLSVLNMMWAEGISGRVLTRQEFDKLELLTTTARQHGVQHIIIFASTKRGSAALKVRDVEKLIDVEVPKADIVNHLRMTEQPSANQATAATGHDHNVLILGSLTNRLHGTQRSVITEKALRALNCLRIAPSPPTLSGLTVAIHDVNRDLIRRVFDMHDDKKILDAFGNAERDNLERVKGVRDKARDQLEPMVCFYSYKENVIDVMVTR